MKLKYNINITILHTGSPCIAPAPYVGSWHWQAVSSLNKPRETHQNIITKHHTHPAAVATPLPNGPVWAVHSLKLGRLFGIRHRNTKSKLQNQSIEVPLIPNISYNVLLQCTRISKIYSRAWWKAAARALGMISIPRKHQSFNHKIEQSQPNITSEQSSRITTLSDLYCLA